MLVGNQDYNSCGHFERLAELVSFDHADLAVDGMAERLTDIALGKRVTDEHYTEVPTYLNEHVTCRNIGTYVGRTKSISLLFAVRKSVRNRHVR
jgi:hypothetical protein